MNNAINSLRITVTAGLVAAALMLTPAAVASASPSADTPSKPKSDHSGSVFGIIPGNPVIGTQIGRAGSQGGKDDGAA